MPLVIFMMLMDLANTKHSESGTFAPSTPVCKSSLTVSMRDMLMDPVGFQSSGSRAKE